MECITKNPFRILGLYADATERDLQRNRAKVTAYLNSQKETQFEQDFPFLSPLMRSTETIEEATSALESDDDRLKHSLFWFIKGNHIDETALENLKAGSYTKTVAIWEKVVANEDQWQHHYSAVNNLSTLKIILSVQADSFDRDYLLQGVSLKLRFIDSNVFSLFVEKTVGTRYNPEPDKTCMLFAECLLNGLAPHLEQRQLHGLDILTMFEAAPANIRSNVRNRLSEQPIQRLSILLEENKRNRKLDATLGEQHANNLVNKGKTYISEIKKLFGTGDIQYQTLADKFAGELLQTAIDYFHAFEDSEETDPTIIALPLMQKAKSYAYGSLIKQRIDKNISDLQEWQDEKPEREKYNKISESAGKLMKLLESFQNKPPKVITALSFATQSKDLLVTIRDKIGRSDDLYIKMSSTIVNNALGMAIAAYNSAQEKINNPYLAIAQGSSTSLVDEITDSGKISSLIRLLGEFDTDGETRQRLELNRSIISNNSRSVSQRTVPSTQSSPDLSWLWWIIGIVVFLVIIGQCGG
jgi:hypothetical protein